MRMERELRATLGEKFKSFVNKEKERLTGHTELPSHIVTCH